jgi:Tol biopolymer transport system component
MTLGRRPIVGAIGVGALTAAAALGAAPAGATPIAFTAGKQGHYQIYTVQPDGRGLRRITHAGDNYDPAVSPNGRELLYVHRGGGRSAIVRTTPRGGAQHDLTGPSHATYGHISFAPGGAKLVLQYGAPFSPAFGLALMDANGSALTLVPGSAGDQDPAFSSDGKRLLYWAETDDDTEQGIFSVGLKGHGVRSLLVSSDYVNDFSVSHGRIVYEQYSNTVGSSCQKQIPGYFPGGIEFLGIAHANGSHSVELTGGTQCDNEEPAFSPNGGQIAFLSDRNGGSPPHAVFNLFVMSTAGAGAVQVTHFQQSLTGQPAW